MGRLVEEEEWLIMGKSNPAADRPRQQSDPTTP